MTARLTAVRAYRGSISPIPRTGAAYPHNGLSATTD
jgi:hypothetical protein